MGGTRNYFEQKVYQSSRYRLYLLRLKQFSSLIFSETETSFTDVSLKIIRSVDNRLNYQLGWRLNFYGNNTMSRDSLYPWKEGLKFMSSFYIGAER